MNAATAAPRKPAGDFEFKSHDLVSETVTEGILFEKRPARTPDGKVVPGLYNAWIILDNPAQYNSYTTDMVKGVILAFRAASNARDVVAVVFTATGDKAFCTGTQDTCARAGEGFQLGVGFPYHAATSSERWSLAD